MLDKSKIATLVKTQSAMPTLKRPPPKGPAPAAVKPAMKPKSPQQPGGDDLTPKDLAALVEEAAQAAEQQQDTQLEDLLVDYMHGDTTQPPAWASDHEKWQKAMDAVGIGGTNEARYDEPYAVVAYLYKKIGGPVAGAPEGQHPEGAPHDEAAEHAAAKPPAPAGAKPPMGAKPMPKPAPKPMGAKPPAAPGAHPAAGAAPAPGDDQGGGDLKQMLDAAAQQAQSNPDPAIMQALQSEPPQEGQPPSWAADHDKWTKAEAAVKPHWQDYPDPFVVVAHVYKNMGGTVGQAPAAGAAPVGHPAPPAPHPSSVS